MGNYYLLNIPLQFYKNVRSGRGIQESNVGMGVSAIHCIHASNPQK